MTFYSLNLSHFNTKHLIGAPFISSQMLVSGGVDSTVCAALLHKALKPDQVIAFHIDNGFMRKDESDQVEKSLKCLGLNLKGKLSTKN